MFKWEIIEAQIDTLAFNVAHGFIRMDQAQSILSLFQSKVGDPENREEWLAKRADEYEEQRVHGYC